MQILQRRTKGEKMKLVFDHIERKLERINHEYEQFVYDYDNAEIRFDVNEYKRIDCIIEFYNGKKFRGVSKLNSREDRWNLIIGQELAQKRCIEKVNNYLANKEIEREEKFIGLFNKEISKCISRKYDAERKLKTK